MVTIIVPTDFSVNAYNALFYATKLVTDGPGKILVVHSFKKELDRRMSVLDPTQNESIVEEVRATIKEKLEAVKHKITLDTEGKDLRFETYLSYKSLSKVINKLILNFNPKCVVMGTKGATGLKQVFIGSQAVNTIKKIRPVPLFLIPQEAEAIPPRQVVYATDLKKDYHQDHFAFVREIIEQHGADLHVCHFYDKDDESSGAVGHYRHLKNKLEGIDLNMHWIANNKGVEEEMTQFLKEHDIDLMVLTYHKYSFMQRLLKISYVEKAGFHSEIPLLVLPDMN